MSKTKTTKQFIEEAKLIHGDKYDYSKVEYVNAKTKVCIICPEHGEFWQTPDKHINNKCGCGKCGDEIVSKKRAKTIEDFIEKARKVHGDKYDYSKVEYVNNHTNIIIICPEHGEFLQLPANHFKGCGCQKCGGNKKLNTNEFIKRANDVHGDKYDYSKVKYKNIDTKVCIICPEHGEFWQSPSCHIYRHYGCPVCDESHLESEIRKLLLDNEITFTQEYNDKWLDKQFLDFYLPDYNTAIECQGEGHFKPVRFNGIGWDKAKNNFKKCVNLDEDKKNKCIKKGVKLIYYSDLKIKFPYKVITDKNKLLNEIKNE